MGIAQNIEQINQELGDTQLVAVSKYSPDEAVQEAFDAGHRVFGENKAQDLQARKERFPEEVQWHFIGHLQRNKVKYIAPFVAMIHAVDSLRLLAEINKQAARFERIIPVLLQVHIAEEESKFGLTKDALFELLKSPELEGYKNIRIEGLMGMATNTADTHQVEEEFKSLQDIFQEISDTITLPNISMKELSMGMSNDYKLALKYGSTMVRIGSSVFK